jgi:hypothetical protein
VLVAAKLEAMAGSIPLMGLVRSAKGGGGRWQVSQTRYIKDERMLVILDQLQMTNVSAEFIEIKYIYFELPALCPQSARGFGTLSRLLYWAILSL